MGLLFKKLFSKGLSTELLIELPPYRWPTLKNLLLHIWEKVGAFIKKAGSIILAFSVIIWLLASLPIGVPYASHESLAGTIGQTIAPVFVPLGFDNWQSGVALTFGLVAKEVIVSTFATLHGATGAVTDSDLLSLALRQYFTPLSAYSFLVFVLLYSPCVATLAVIKKETGSYKWVLFVIANTLLVAYITALIIYQGGKLIGLN
jgi:ferrous iron transport protein B